jgi:MOSC domain-containing protein YiiM
VSVAPSAGPAPADSGVAPAVARLVSVNLATEKGVRKSPRSEVALVADHGVRGDAHAGPWHRQVSLLAEESVQKMRDKGLEVNAGDFGENLPTAGIVLYELPIGTRLNIGETLLEVTQIGKVCHDHCAIYYAAGDCVMPREGIFARVLKGGLLRAGDTITVIETEDGRK